MQYKATIAILEDDESVGQILLSALLPQGYRIFLCRSIAERNALFAKEKIDLLVSDIGLDDGDGLESLEALYSLFPSLKVIIISAKSHFETAVRASDKQAFAYFPKPFDLNKLIRSVNQALNASIEDNEGKNINSEEEDKGPLVGQSPPIQDIYSMIAKVRHNKLPLLIHGESGTGKHLVARTIHEHGIDKDKPLILINFASIEEEEAINSLFSPYSATAHDPVRTDIHDNIFGDKGTHMDRSMDESTFASSTAPVEARPINGWERARGGTIILSTIEHIPQHFACKLLAQLTVDEFHAQAIPRLISISTQQPQNLLDNGKLTAALFFRLSTIPIPLPSLRDRREDISALVAHFTKSAQADGLPVKSFSEEALHAMRQYRWPGNVRELRNLIYRLLVSERDIQIEADHLTPYWGEGSEPTSVDNIDHARLDRMISTLTRRKLVDNKAHRQIYHSMIDILETSILRTTLRHCKGNQQISAQILGINRNTFKKKIDRLGIEPKNP